MWRIANSGEISNSPHTRDRAGRDYLPALLRRLDICQQSFRKTEPALNLPLKASYYLRRQVKPT